jgi:hypothetical protein
MLRIGRPAAHVLIDLPIIKLQRAWFGRESFLGHQRQVRYLDPQHPRMWSGGPDAVLRPMCLISAAGSARCNSW